MMADSLTALDGRIDDGRHVMNVRVYYEDTDFSAPFATLKIPLFLQDSAGARRVGNKLSRAFIAERIKFNSWLGPVRSRSVFTTMG
jgi:hypothetical protein